MRIPANLKKKAGMFAFLLVGLPFAAWLKWPFGDGWLWYVTIVVLCVVVFWEAIWLPVAKHGGDTESATMLGIWALIAFASMYWLRTMDHGFGLVMMAQVGAGATDTFASIVGSYFGKTKEVVKESPNKSREGFIAGYLIGLVAVFIAYNVFRDATGWDDRSTIAGFVAGLMIATIPLAAIKGDLVASGVKRRLGDVTNGGIKDFSRFFGSHGGVLDRFDSWIFVFPIVTVYAIVAGFAW